MKTAALHAVMGLLLLTGPAEGQELGDIDWKPANQVTIDWTAPDGLETGDPLPPEDSFAYRVYAKVQGEEEVAEQTTEPLYEQEFTLTFTGEGRFLVGVRALRMRDDVELSRSPIVWSDDSEIVEEGQPWGILHYIMPEHITGLLRR